MIASRIFRLAGFPLCFGIIFAQITMAVEQDARVIARKALRTLPPDRWTLSAVLSTRLREGGGGDAASANAVAKAIAAGEQRLTIQFQHAEDGSAQIVYRGGGEGKQVEGVRIVIAADEREPTRIFDLRGGAALKDFGAPFLKSAFDLEDLALSFLAWKNQKLLGEETIKDRPCWKLVSQPSRDDSASYVRVESWIDQEYGALLKAVAYNAKDEVAKEFSVRSFQQMDEIWMLKELDLNAPLLKAKSRLEILDARKR